MQALVESWLTEEQVAWFTRELAFEFDDADFTSMVDEAGAPIRETLPLWTILLDPQRVECSCSNEPAHLKEIAETGRSARMPCRDLEINWRLHRINVMEWQTYYSPCEGVKLNFEWRMSAQKWIIRVLVVDNRENAEQVAKLLEAAKA